MRLPSDDSLSEAKRALRKEMRTRRAELSPAEVELSSERIAQQVIPLPEWQSAQTVHIFVGSLPGEVKTDGIITDCFERNCRVMIPVIDQSTRSMRSVWLKSLDELIPTSWGGREPVNADIADESAIDIVIVPGVAFDREGHRLGMGAGYYDRFLRNIRAPRIAVAHSVQLIEHIPTDATDESVDIVIIPNETIVCPRYLRFKS